MADFIALINEEFKRLHMHPDMEASPVSNEPAFCVVTDTQEATLLSDPESLYHALAALPDGAEFQDIWDDALIQFVSADFRIEFDHDEGIWMKA